MAMSKKDFIALADTIRWANHRATQRGFGTEFTPDQLEILAEFCKVQNPAAFMHERWLDYIAGNCGKNGGSVKTGRAA